MERGTKCLVFPTLLLISHNLSKLRIITEQGVGNVVKKYPFTKLYIPTNTYIE